jgi:hypothetical protein
MIFPELADFPQATENQMIDRRSALGTLGLAGLGLALTSSVASANPNKKPMSTPRVTIPTATSPRVQNIPRTAIPFTPVSDIPEEWTAVHGRAANEYLRYLNSLNLRRVSPAQVVKAHAKQKGTVWNSVPPKTWWNRMGYVLRVVERVAMEMNVNQVEVISAYRSPSYNARCAGARAGSWHQANVAVDVKFPVRASQVTSTARNLRDLGLFKGGVGGYWNFTHIDARGQNINW